MLARKIAYNVVFSGITKILCIGINIFSMGMLQRYLGREGYGKYTTILFFPALLEAMGNLGLYQIMTQQISKENVDEDEIVSKIFSLRIIISTFSFLILTFIVLVLPDSKFFPYPQDVRLGILIASLSFIFSSSYGLLIGVFQKNLVMNRVSLIEFFAKIVQASIIIVTVFFQKSFIFAVTGLLASMLFSFILVYWNARKYVKINLNFDLNYWKNFLKKSLPLGISAMATFLYFRIDTFILSIYQTQDQVGTYGAAYKIIESLTFFPAMVTGLVFPLFSRYFKENEEKFNKIINITLKFFVIMVVPMIISVQFLADEMVVIIGGKEFLSSAEALRILIFALGCIFFGQLFTNVLIATSQQKKLMFIALGIAFFNLSMNFIFIPKFSYLGASYISVASEFLVAFLAFSILWKKDIYKPFLPKTKFILLAGVSMFSVYYLSEKLFSFSYLILAITIILAVSIYFAIIFIFKVVSKREMQQLLMKDSQIVITEN